MSDKKISHLVYHHVLCPKVNAQCGPLFTIPEGKEEGLGLRSSSAVVSVALQLIPSGILCSSRATSILIVDFPMK
jgi:hypothetical protein